MPKPTKDPGTISFDGLIEGNQSGAFVSFPYDLKELYGIGNLVPVIITFEGVDYQGSIAKIVGPTPVLLIKKSIREQIGKQPGDKISVSVKVDNRPRTVEIPAELQALFQINPKVRDIFAKLAFSHQREYAQWIASAKQVETRQRRAKSAISDIAIKGKNK